MIGRPIVNIDR